MPGTAISRRRSPNAQLAVEMYEDMRSTFGWTKSDAWQGIARLLLSCEIWSGKSWQPFHGVVIYRESNDFKFGAKGPNAHLRRAAHLSAFLADRLGIPHNDICDSIGQYWRHKDIANLQPHNPVGHAFRSLLVHILEVYGDPALIYDEEVSPHLEYPGYQFGTRSKDEDRRDCSAQSRSGCFDFCSLAI